MHSLECDVEIANFKIRDLKSELEQAKKTNTNLEARLKNRKMELEKLKIDYKKMSHDNEILKRVVYDSRSHIQVEDAEEVTVLKECLAPSHDDSKHGSRPRDNKSKIRIDDSYMIDYSMCDQEIQTETKNKLRDRFTQTEKHGYVNLMKILEIKRNTQHNKQLIRRLSTLTSVGVQQMDDNLKVDFKQLDVPQSDKISVDNQIIYSESESLMESSQIDDVLRDEKIGKDISKIRISPLEHTDTRKSDELQITEESPSKILKNDPPETRDSQVSRPKRLSNIENFKSDRSTTSQLIKRDANKNKDELFLSGEKINQLNVIDKYRRYITSRERDFVSTLISDNQSRKTSIEDNNRMSSIYEQKHPMFIQTHKTPLSKVRGKTNIYIKLSLFHIDTFSPQAKKSAGNLDFGKWDEVKTALSPSRFKNKHIESQFMKKRAEIGSQKDMRKVLRNAFIKQ